MKILICNRHRSTSLGGSEIQCDLLADYLHRRGHRVRYAAFESDEPPASTAYPVEPVPRVTAPRLFPLLHRFEPDLLYWRYNRNTFLRIGLLAHLLGICTVFSVSNPKDVQAHPAYAVVHRPWWTPAGGRRLLRRRAQQLVGRLSYEGFRFYDGAISLSIDLLHRLPPPPLGPSHRAVIYNSMTDEDVQPFHWPRPYIAWVANLKACKNPHQFIDAAEALADLEVDFLMCGEVQHPQFEFVNDPDNLPPNLFYLGPRPVAEVNGLLDGALCMAHTCDPEGFGNCFIQAWLQGTPTVSLYFDPDGLIETRRLGHLSQTPRRFHRHLRQLVHAPDRRRAMGRRAQNFARQAFAPGRNLPQFEAFFTAVTKARRAGSSD